MAPNVSMALKRAPQAIIEITTSYEIGSRTNRPRSLPDSLSFAINPSTVLGGGQRRRFSLSPNHWIHGESQLQYRSYLSRTSVLSTAVEPIAVKLECQEGQNTNPAKVRYLLTLNQCSKIPHL